MIQNLLIVRDTHTYTHTRARARIQMSISSSQYALQRIHKPIKLSRNVDGSLSNYPYWTRDKIILNPTLLQLRDVDLDLQINRSYCKVVNIDS